MDTELIDKIIPPNDHDHREAFTNKPIIDRLSDKERVFVENALIDKLLLSEEDMLIVVTLSYMQSNKALPILKKVLLNSKEPIVILIIATSIFNIQRGEEFADIALEAFKNIHSKYTLIAAVYYLKLLNNSRAIEELQKLTVNSDYLISYNAKRALENNFGTNN